MFWKEKNMSRLSIIQSDYQSGRHNTGPKSSALSRKKSALLTIKPRVPEPVTKRGSTLRINYPEQDDK